MEQSISQVEDSRALVPTPPEKSVDNDHTFEEIQERVQIVADMLHAGRRSTKSIMAELQCARPTAIKYRNRALTLIAEESKPMNREALRNIEVGRLNSLLETISDKMNALEWPDSKVDPKGHDRSFFQYDKLLQRLKDVGEQLHKITGLNTEINVTVEEKRRIVFVRPTKPVQPDIVEGEVISS